MPRMPRVAAEAERSRAPLSRDLEAAQNARYDAIIVGGGIQGVCLLHEASRRGLRALLIEQNDFGGATSWNSMRILHGGFRYLQSMDLPRYCESVRARRWFMRMFPGLTGPLECLMPLYGGGLKRPEAFWAATMMNRQLVRLEGRHRNEPKLNPGRALSAREVAVKLPWIPRRGLKGGGLWCDAVLRSPERAMMHLLRVAAGRGCGALNYVRAEGLVTSNGSVVGAMARDTESGREVRFDAPVVINAAGPWCKPLAKRLGDARPDLFIPMRSFNVVLDIEPRTDYAMAVASRRTGSQTYFVVPMGDRVVAGTAQVAVEGDDFGRTPSEAEVLAFLEQINEAAPGLDADLSSVVCVWSGLVPADYSGSTRLSDRAQILEHGRLGGPEGLVSVSGVKLTAAPMLAQRVMDRIPSRPVAPKADEPCLEALGEIPGYGGDLRGVGTIARDESVRHVEDLVFRRTGLWQDARGTLEAFDRIASSIGLEASRYGIERERLHRSLRLMARPWESNGGVG